ncbi:unnamed protein product [Didymodactylos carnosus]|uniref:Uncharacterized protein n=1 Tax=Didymodactylos carnosus TaxID=1234261 RepID=A0A813WUZ6_9BILA|nr:unnamed protein product [Didymodactylos carnosus]CAF1614929.1 unnamed protein product [Didymodactylos carnosus]CAF3648558.1 unnamed protein product [Didymodactylos carnosus]CAF4430649.1 unnamed protein product [Didymodactylos carnosus]
MDTSSVNNNQIDDNLLSMDSKDNNEINFLIGEQNLNTIVCLYCEDIILRPKTAKYEQKHILLPQMDMKKTSTPSSNGNSIPINVNDHLCDSVAYCWLVNDMFTFENVGFSKTVNNNVKYLMCSNCERGPIGYCELNPTTGELDKHFYVAFDRVKYK